MYNTKIEKIQQLLKWLSFERSRVFIYGLKYTENYRWACRILPYLVDVAIIF